MIITKPRLSWHALDVSSGTPPIDLLHEPAARQALDHVLAVQMQLELATGVPVAIYGPTGQILPGISPAKTRQAEQQMPLAKDVLAPQNWPQSIGQLLEVTYDDNLHLFITPFIVGSLPIAQFVLGPLQLFEPGAQDSRIDGAARDGKLTPLAGVPVLASWKAQAAAELARTLVSRLSLPAADHSARLAAPASLLPVSDRETTALPIPPNGRCSQQGTAPRLGALAQDAMLPERAAINQSQRVIESIQQAENQPRAASLIRTLLDSMPQAVIISAAPDGQVVLANRAARTLWPRLLGGHAPGAQTSGLLPRRISAEEYPPEWLGLRVALRQAESFRGEVSVETVENDGPPERPMLVSAFPLRTAQGAVSHAVALFEDLSGLLERERFKDELLVLAAHDARNPLTLIGSQAQLLERSLMMELAPGQGLERARERLAEIHEQVRVLAELTHQLYTVTRLQSAQQRPHAETVDLACLIQRATIDQQMLTPGHPIEAALACERCPVQGDQAQLQQIIMHLLKNAVKYSHPDRPICVSLRCTPTSAPRWAEVSVRDQGIGIPRASLPHLFERFHRAAGSEQRAHAAGLRLPGDETSNLGLSLYLCKQLLERMGGHIWAESREGQGTTISFTLPLRR